MRKSLQLPTKKGVSLISLRDNKELAKQAVLYMTGSETFRLGSDEILNLKRYLTNGGFLFADSACSCEEFHQSFTSMLRRLFPHAKLEVIPRDSPLYQDPFQHDMKFTSALKKTHPEKEPFLLGLRQDDRYVVIYSPLDFSSALANQLDDGSKGIASPAAFRLVTNIISYALSY
ncbi:MAG: DUF4159 domain-containing protein [Lentisphaeraceae bacterium]|nr:DUF4159 domain-containing protein [Lentisphaeraceae bacterium]